MRAVQLISIKDYAKEKNVSYEAVRQQVIRYGDELGEHIIKNGRQQFLDQEAVAFLDEKRKKNPVTIIQMDKDEEIEALRREKENLLIKVAAQADKIAELSEWKAETAISIAKAETAVAMIEAKQQEVEDLQKQNDEQRRALEQSKTDYATEKDRADFLQQINQDLMLRLESEKKKTWWDKLWGK